MRWCRFPPVRFATEINADVSEIHVHANWTGFQARFAWHVKRPVEQGKETYTLRYPMSVNGNAR